MSMSQEEMLIKISADLSDLKREMSRGTEAVNKMAKDAESASARMSKGFNTATTALKAFVTVAALKQGFDALYGVLDRLDNLGDTADKIGITAERLQELRYAAERSGSSADVMDAALKRFNISVGNARQGTGELAESLKRYNIALTNTDGTLKTNSQLFDEYLKILGQTADITQRAALEVAAFGKTGADLDGLFRKGLTGVNDLAEAARNLGIVLSDDVVSGAGAAKDKIDDLKAVVAAEFTKAIADNADAIGEWADRAREAFGYAIEHADELKVVLKALAAATAAIWTMQTITAIGNFIKLMRELNVVTKIQAALQASLAVLTGRPWLAAGAVLAAIGTYKLLNAQLEDTKENLEDLGQGAKEQFLAQYQAAATRLAGELQKGGKAADDARKALELLHAQGVKLGYFETGDSTPTPPPSPLPSGSTSSTKKPKAETPYVYEHADPMNEGMSSITDDLVLELGDLTTEIQKPADILLQTYSNVFEEVANSSTRATYQMLEDWKDTTSQMDFATMSWLGQTSEALTNFVMTGKADFKSLANSIIKDLIRIYMQELLVKSIGMLFSGGASAAGGTGTSGVAFDSKAAYGSFSANLAAPFGKAGGGHVNPSSTYMVGERGPELFTPPTVGKIHPTGTFGGGGGSVKVEIVNKGTPQQAVSQSTQFDPRGMVVQVITEDMRRNGPISAGMSQLYGLRRQT